MSSSVAAIARATASIVCALSINVSNKPERKWLNLVADNAPQSLTFLNRRLARGEIDKTEYDEKRKLIGR